MNYLSLVQEEPFRERKEIGENMFYLVIDLEMCKVPRYYRERTYKYANETIQIGAVLLDEDFKRIGNREYKIYAWSESDRDQIMHEMKAKKIDDIRITSFVEKEKWIDYQSVFMKRFDLNRQISLEEALERAEIEPEGKFHDGLDDAVNTGYLIKKLELNPEYQLIQYELPEEESKPLSSTLGELFSGLDLLFV